MIIWHDKTRATHPRADDGKRPLAFDMTVGPIAARLDDYSGVGWTLRCDAVDVRDLHLNLGACTPGEAQIEAERIIRGLLQEVLRGL